MRSSLPFIALAGLCVTTLALVTLTQLPTHTTPDASPSPTPSQQACTQEAKLCPDGSSVSRTGADCAFAPCPSSAPSATRPTDSSATYRNAAYGFSLNAPIEANVLEYDKAKAQSPACETDSPEAQMITCVHFPKSLYPNSNFLGAGVAITLVPNVNELQCLTPDTTAPSKKITHEPTFTAWPHAEGAMSHRVSGTTYAAFANNTCYHVNTRIYSSVYEVYAEGTITEFTTAQRTDIENILEIVAMSFGFI
jgi:hypothetical protein